MLTVYLEQIGIANEVMQFFGLDKFRLGRILWARHRSHLPHPGAEGPEADEEGSEAGELAVDAAAALDEAAKAAAAVARANIKGAAGLIGAGEVVLPVEGQEMKRDEDAAAGGEKAATGKAAAAAAATAAAAVAAAAAEKGAEEAGGDDEAAADPDEDGEAQHTALFTLWVGNGLFWIVPFLLQWLTSRTIGSGLIDNGRLDDKRFG